MLMSPCDDLEQGAPEAARALLKIKRTNSISIIPEDPSQFLGTKTSERPAIWGRHYSKRGWSKRMINEGVCEGVLSDPPTGIFCVVTRADALRSSPRSKLSGSTR